MLLIKQFVANITFSAIQKYLLYQFYNNRQSKRFQEKSSKPAQLQEVFNNLYVDYCFASYQINDIVKY